MPFSLNGFVFPWDSPAEFWGSTNEYGEPTPLLTEYVIQLEHQLGAPLPSLFKELLAACNGGFPEYSYFPFLDNDGTLLNFVSFEEVHTLDQNYFRDWYVGDFTEAYRSWPKGVLAITDLSDSVFICLDYRNLNSSEEPKVIQVRMTPRKNLIPSEKTDYYCIYVVANSFDNFIHQLLTEDQLNELILKAPASRKLFPL